MDTQTSSGLPRFQVLCLNGVPWFMKLFISTRTQYIHMSYAALILVYTAEEEVLFLFCFFDTQVTVCVGSVKNYQLTLITCEPHNDCWWPAF